MPSSQSTHRFSIDGPAGSLEARYVSAGAPIGRVAVLCHPHPLYGGTMDDAVLDLVERALLARGIDCVRFNFRGVGMSDGSFDHGNGETFDLRAVVRWTRDNKGAAQLWLAGYSFGSYVAWAAAGDLGAERVWLIAPPIGRMSYPPRPTLAAPVDVFLGTDDDFADLNGLEAWRRTAARDVRVHLIDGGDHFFSGREHALASELAAASE